MAINILTKFNEDWLSVRCIYNSSQRANNFCGSCPPIAGVPIICAGFFSNRCIRMGIFKHYRISIKQVECSLNHLPSHISRSISTRILQIEPKFIRLPTNQRSQSLDRLWRCRSTYWSVFYEAHQYPPSVWLPTTVYQPSELLADSLAPPVVCSNPAHSLFYCALYQQGLTEIHTTHI